MHYRLWCTLYAPFPLPARTGKSCMNTLHHLTTYGTAAIFRKNWSHTLGDFLTPLLQALCLALVLWCVGWALYTLASIVNSRIGGLSVKFAHIAVSHSIGSTNLTNDINIMNKQQISGKMQENNYRVQLHLQHTLEWHTHTHTHAHTHMHTHTHTSYSEAYIYDSARGEKQDRTLWHTLKHKGGSNTRPQFTTYTFFKIIFAQLVGIPFVILYSFVLKIMQI